MANDASKFSIYNMDEIRKSKLVGCYYCLFIYPPSEIKETTDDGKTAICTNCGIDSVLPDTSPFTLDNQTLKELHKIWF